MRGSQAKSIVWQISLLGILTIVIAGLTFLFNLFATLGVSVLTGMMAGAWRRWNWQVITVSFLSPLVALALEWFMNPPIDFHHWLSLTGICLCAFWGTWLMTWFLMSLEARSETSAEKRAGPMNLVGQPAVSATVPESRAAKVNSEIPAGLHLDDLQGTWSVEARMPDASAGKKLFVVDGDKFSLSVVDALGQIHSVFHGKLLVQSESRILLSLTCHPPQAGNTPSA